MMLICGSDLYLDEVCYTNIIDNKLYPVALSIPDESLGDLGGYYRATDKFRMGELVRINGKKLYKL